MDETNQPQASQGTEPRHHGSPEGMIIGAFAPDAVASVTAALVAAGFAADQVEVMTAADLERLESQIDRRGLGGALGRFLLSLGDDLDELEKARQELASGHVLIGVPAMGSDTIHHVRDVMRDNGGHGITHFGRWAITTFD
jgi:hypothetical protein